MLNRQKEKTSCQTGEQEMWQVGVAATSIGRMFVLHGLFTLEVL